MFPVKKIAAQDNSQAVCACVCLYVPGAKDLLQAGEQGIISTTVILCVEVTSWVILLILLFCFNWG